MRRPLIDLDQLRVAIPDPTKRAVWLFGATTAATNGLRESTERANEAFQKLSAVLPSSDQGDRE